MNKDELRDLYESGRLESTQMLMAHRSEILEYADLVVPRRAGDVAEWWEDNKSVFARRIAEDMEDSEETEDSSDQE